MLMRIRTVKPAFFTHRDLYVLEKQSGLPIRVAYEGLWCACDRAGRFEWKPGPLKLAIIPHDECGMLDVLLALAGELYVVQYIVNGRGYGWLPTMPVHQSINAREQASMLPPPPRNVVAWYQAAMLAQNMGMPFTEPNPVTEQVNGLPELLPYRQGDSTDMRRQGSVGAGGASVLRDNDLQEGSRVGDASGTRQADDLDASVTRADAPSLPVVTRAIAFTQQQPVETLSSETARARDDAGRSGEHAGALQVYGAGGGSTQSLPAIRGKRDVQAVMLRLATTLDEVTAGRRDALNRDQWRRIAAELVFAYWAKSFGKERSFLTDNDPRERKILARMAENDDDVSELLYALDGAKRSKFLMGDNESRTVYDGIETLLRDRAQVEKLSSKCKAWRDGEPHPMILKYAAALVGIGAPDALRTILARASQNGNGTTEHHAPEAAP